MGTFISINEKLVGLSILDGILVGKRDGIMIGWSDGIMVGRRDGILVGKRSGYPPDQR